jgi:hypothetical protein
LAEDCRAAIFAAAVNDLAANMAALQLNACERFALRVPSAIVYGSGFE